MSSSIERINTEGAYGGVKAFLVKLSDSDPFDALSFDTHVKALSEDKTTPYIFLKWIVKGDKLMIFEDLVDHARFNYLLEQMGDDNELISAGQLSVIFSDVKTERFISGYSVTLQSVLPEEQSNAYKLGCLKEIFGEFFTIR